MREIHTEYNANRNTRCVAQSAWAWGEKALVVRSPAEVNNNHAATHRSL